MGKYTNPGSRSKHTFKSAAYEILKRYKRPMTSKDLTDIILGEKMIHTSGKTPDRTLSSLIYTEVNARGNDSLFVVVRSGVFGLREFDDDSSEFESSVHTAYRFKIQCPIPYDEDYGFNYLKWFVRESSRKAKWKRSGSQKAAAPVCFVCKQMPIPPPRTHTRTRSRPAAPAPPKKKNTRQTSTSTSEDDEEEEEETDLSKCDRCNMFYHPECLQGEGGARCLMREEEEEEEPTPNTTNTEPHPPDPSKPFYCPRHVCCRCGEMFRQFNLVRCVSCPVSYCKSCLKKSRNTMFEIPNGARVCKRCRPFYQREVAYE